jgi:hypothetical protein
MAHFRAVPDTFSQNKCHRPTLALRLHMCSETNNDAQAISCTPGICNFLAPEEQMSPLVIQSEEKTTNRVK